MTKGDLETLRRWFMGYLDRFRKENGELHPLLALKRSHSFRVAENARYIATALRLTEGERCLAEAAGLVHDVGRFTQFIRYGSFRDADTVDHGMEGRQVLEAGGIALFLNPGDCEDLFYAVEYHNRKQAELPINFDEEKDRLLRLLRDADKIDIIEVVLRAVAADGFQDLPEMLPHIVLSRKVSPCVMKAARETKSLAIGQVVTLSDFLILIVTWFSDLNYSPTRELAVKRDVLYRLRRELPNTKAVRNLFADIDEAMNVQGWV